MVVEGDVAIVAETNDRRVERDVVLKPAVVMPSEFLEQRRFRANRSVEVGLGMRQDRRTFKVGLQRELRTFKMGLWWSLKVRLGREGQVGPLELWRVVWAFEVVRGRVWQVRSFKVMRGRIFMWTVWAWRVAMQMFVVMIVQRAFLVREEFPNRSDDALVGCHVEVHKRLNELLAVLALRDLQRKQRIDVQQTEIEAVGTDRSEVWVGSVWVTVRGDWITVRGVRQAE